jgi:thiol-disulfide isomerase/thioredoxin
MRNPYCLVLLWILYPVSMHGADGDRTVVHLEIKRGVLAFSMQGINFGQSRDEAVIAQPGTTRVGKVPGASVIAQPVAGQAHAYSLTIQGGTGDPVMATVLLGHPAHIELPRRAGTLPYLIDISPNAGPNGTAREVLYWQNDYRAEGTLTLGSCKALLAIWDMSGDGEFNRNDFTHGSAVGIDINGDGKILGRGEFVTGGEIFQICGKSLYVDPDSLEPDGSAVTVVETSTVRPQIGSPMPSLVLTTTDGKSIHSESWKGTLTLLDFWASWCGICVAEFPRVKEIHKTFSPSLNVISVNTDEPSRVTAANKILRENDLPWPTVLSGEGLADPVWRTFQDGTGIPLYILVDREGVIRYRGSGGDKLEELQTAIRQLSPPGNR